MGGSGEETPVAAGLREVGGGAAQSRRGASKEKKGERAVGKE